MNRFVVLPLVALLTLPALGQETHKCKINGNTVYQDRPCPGAVRYSSDLPAATPKATNEPQQVVNDSGSPSMSQGDAQRAKLEKDKAYLDERVKVRVFEREKSESQERIAQCEAEASNLMAAADAALSAPGYVYNNNLAGAVAAQAENQRRQTEVMALQGKASARRSQCDLLRREHESRFSAKR